jgi:hypothetical protein
MEHGRRHHFEPALHDHDHDLSLDAESLCPGHGAGRRNTFAPANLSLQGAHVIF